MQYCEKIAYFQNERRIMEGHTYMHFYESELTQSGLSVEEVQNLMSYFEEQGLWVRKYDSSTADSCIVQYDINWSKSEIVQSIIQG
jgi:hypothetical protein